MMRGGVSDEPIPQEKLLLLDMIFHGITTFKYQEKCSVKNHFKLLAFYPV